MEELWAELMKYVGAHAAEVVALSTAALVLYQAMLSRTHNRLSVRPHLQRKGNVDQAPDVYGFSFELLNSGIGPALITNWKLYLDGVEQYTPTREDLDAFINQLFPNHTTLQFYFIGRKDALRADESIKLLSTTFPADPTAVAKFEAQLKRLALVVEYSSMYGEKMKALDTRSPLESYKKGGGMADKFSLVLADVVEAVRRTVRRFYSPGKKAGQS
jgi:hypothetical protein